MHQDTLEGFRLSPQQQRVWLLQQETPCQPYRAQCAVLLEGNIDKATLQVALQRVVNRHQILRTTFRFLPGMRLPLQVIADSHIAWGHDVNLSHVPPPEQETRIEALFEELSQLPFDFEQGPLLHVCLVTLSSQKHVLYVSVPAL